jgi:hypothetical protein
MKLNPPSELQNYQYEQKSASRSSLLSRVLGWLSVLSFAGAVYSFIFLPEERVITVSSIVGFIVLFSLYIIVKILKRHFRCSQCQQIMDVIDVKWTPEEWKQIQGYELFENFKGADGNLYTTEREKSAGSTHYFIHAHIQRWYACHQCRLYFLNARYLRETLLSTIYEDEFEEAKRSLLSDPEANKKIEAAYKARLQGGQTSEER